MNMQKYYEQLVGGKIVGFRFERDEYEDEYEDEYADQLFPVFTLQLGSQRVDLTLSMDEEGNGGGFGFIEEAV